MKEKVLTEEQLMSVNGGSWGDVRDSILGNVLYDLIKFGIEHL